MSVCCNCVKSTDDSKENHERTIFLNISDSCIEYDIFDSDQSVVVSNNYVEIYEKDLNDISSKISLIKIK